MCGIAGIISLGQHLSESDLQQGERMTSILHHRGPDSRGFLSDERCFLGNTRLSVIDLSTKADLPINIAYSHEAVETEFSSTLQDLGNPVDLDYLLFIFFDFFSVECHTSLL